MIALPTSFPRPLIAASKRQSRLEPLTARPSRIPAFENAAMKPLHLLSDKVFRSAVLRGA